MSDARALAELGSLLEMAGEPRARRLRQIAAEDPRLHGHVIRLLAAAESAQSSQVFAAPVAAGLEALQSRSATTLRTGETVAGYRLLRELGHGGMAVVWLAERLDGVVKRPVALKLPLYTSRYGTDTVRFEREREVLAALSHANIARLYDAGISSAGQPFIVLEYIDGQALTSYCDAKRLDIPARLSLFGEVLAAVEHAHRHLVVHRDLKPSNILVDGEGHVKLLDFGIARLLGDAQRDSAPMELTQHGVSVFTPLYAAPEQVKSEAISTATDIYVLGIVLHELLTGCLPYGGRTDRPSLAQFITALTRGALSRPSDAPISEEAAAARACASARKLRASLAGDLDTIVQKAMRPDPGARYASVAHFAEDLRRYLEHRPLAARPAGMGYRARLFLRRHRAATVIAVAGLGVALVAGVVAWQGFAQSRRFEARSIAVRDFLFDFVSDTEPTESADPQATGMVGLLQSAEARARVEFADQPAFRGELLGELGRLYGRHGDDARRLSLLEEALKLLEASVPDDDPALNTTRAHLADALRDVDQGTRARQLAERARDSCRGPSPDCAKARAYAFTVLGTLENRAGDTERAFADMRAAAAETERGFGPRHAETAGAWQRLATMYRNGGRILPASEAIRRAYDIAKDVSLRKADRDGLLRAMAVVDFDMGRYTEARDRLTTLLATPKPPRERAVQRRILANSLIALGEPGLALESAAEAMSAAQESESGIEEALALQAHARAAALLGRWDQAALEHENVVARLLNEGYAEDSLDVLRARRYAAEVQLRRGQAEQAASVFEDLVARYRAMPALPELELAHALDLLGCARRELRQPALAAALHREARAILHKNLPANHPFLTRNTLYTGLATGDREQLAQAARRGDAFLSPDSLWRLLVEAQLDASQCAQTRLPLCVMVL